MGPNIEATETSSSSGLCQVGLPFFGRMYSNPLFAGPKSQRRLLLIMRQSAKLPLLFMMSTRKKV